MGLDEFLAVLRETRGEFRWECRGRLIRTLAPDDEMPDCPVTAVARHLGHPDIWPSICRQAAKKIGMTSALAGKIADAADGAKYGSAVLREQLLEAVGLTEG